MNRSLIALTLEVRRVADLLPGASEVERADLEARLEEAGEALYRLAGDLALDLAAQLARPNPDRLRRLAGRVAGERP